jgi:hypothetical protein
MSRAPTNLIERHVDIEQDRAMTVTLRDVSSCRWWSGSPALPPCPTDGTTFAGQWPLMAQTFRPTFKIALDTTHK